MPHSKCLECNTRLHATKSQAEPIGDLCPVCGSLLKSVGDLGEIVGCRLVESRGGTSRSGASPAGQLIGRVGEIIARRGLKHARVRLGIDRRDAHSVSSRVQTVGSHAPGTGDEAVRCRRRAPPSAALALSRAAASAARHPCFRRGASSGRTAPPDESLHSLSAAEQAAT